MSSLHEPQVVSDELKKKYEDILKVNGISDEVKTITSLEPEELKGEHMATATIYVQVEFKDPSIKPKNLFVKKFVENETYKDMVKKMQIMEKESNFFLNFLPEAQEFCKNYPGYANEYQLVLHT